MGAGLGAGSAQAGYQLDTLAVGNGSINAVAADAAGKLYLGHSGSQDLTVIDPDGVFSTLTVTGASLVNLGGGWINPATGDLLLADSKGFGDGLGDLYAVNTVTGAASTLASGIDTIADVAVSPTGGIFVSNADGPPGLASIFRIDPSGGVAETVMTGLDYGAGLAFDLAGNLIVLQSNASFAAEVYRIQITENGGFSYGAPESLATGGFGAYGLAVDSEGDIWTTGGGGLWELDADDSFTASQIWSNDNPWQFAGAIAFLTGDGPFDAGQAPNSGRLLFVPDFGAQDLAVLSVPEPGAAALLAMAGAGLMMRRPRRRHAPAG